jgi:hypothetical protein
MMRTYCVSLAKDMKPSLNERPLAFSTSAEAKFSLIVAPNAGDWHERLQLGSAGSVRMTGTPRINWRKVRRERRWTLAGDKPARVKSANAC